MATDYFQGDWRNQVPVQGHRESFAALGERLCLYDLGSTGGTPPPFCFVLDAIKLVNFEPHPRGESEPHGNTLPVAIGPPEHSTLYLNKRPTTSSLLPPEKRVVERYDFCRTYGFDDPDIFTTIKTETVPTMGLDEAIRRYGLDAPDFLKVDVQGLCQEVLETGAQCLRDSVLGLQVEVEFLETYSGQKTFGHIHEYLYAAGYEIFELINVNRWYYKTSLPLTTVKGQDVFCDLLYLKKIDTIVAAGGFWTEAKAVKFLQLCLLYDLTDYAAACLDRFEKADILDAECLKRFRGITSGWTTAMEYFYQEPPGRHALRSFKKKILDVNLRAVLRKLRSVLG